MLISATSSTLQQESRHAVKTDGNSWMYGLSNGPYSKKGSVLVDGRHPKPYQILASEAPIKSLTNSLVDVHTGPSASIVIRRGNSIWRCSGWSRCWRVSAWQSRRMISRQSRAVSETEAPPRRPRYIVHGELCLMHPVRTTRLLYYTCYYNRVISDIFVVLFYIYYY